MKMNRIAMTACSRAAEIGFLCSRGSAAYPRQASCLHPARPPHKTAHRAEPDEPKREDTTRDQLGINHPAWHAIGLSLAVGFIVGAGSLFAWSLGELIKLADRGMSSFMQSQLWIPR
jgi:hypothetical protein